MDVDLQFNLVNSTNQNQQIGSNQFDDYREKENDDDYDDHSNNEDKDDKDNVENSYHYLNMKQTNDMFI